MSTQQQQIYREMTIDEIFSRFPHKSQRLAYEMTQIGLHCVGCHASTHETLEAGMLTHGFADSAVDDLVKKLNSILEEEQDLTSICLTPKAAKKVLEILEEEKKMGWGLRLTEKPAGCNGFEYVLDFSEKAGETDDVLTSHGIELHINKGERPRLLGSVIDYVDGLMGAGFKVSNPNVRSSCGCGNSHGY